MTETEWARFKEDSIPSDIYLMECFRKKSDEFAIFYYFAASFFIGTMYSFIDSLFYVNIFYMNFDLSFIFFLFIFFIYDRNRFKKLGIETSNFSRSEKYHLFDYGITGLIAVILIYAFFYIIWEFYISMFIPIYVVEGSGSAGLKIEYQIFRLIPSEEFVFRGFGMALITGGLSVLFYLKKPSTIEESQSFRFKYHFIWGVAIFLTGILFGLYHIYKFNGSYYPYFAIGYDVDGNLLLTPIYAPILYLSLLGILLGYIRYKYGLSYAILIHIVNNLLANGFPVFYYGIFLIPLWIIGYSLNRKYHLEPNQK